jgi:DNA-binding LytR/AlgR family response regulator
MNIVIIEDENPAATRLAKLVKEVVPVANIVATLESIDAARIWFLQNAFPDLVFLDIHLADGSAFDLLKLVKIDCPLIFTTAYDKYALDAFKASSIDYILKPVKKTDLETAIQKLRDMQHIFRHNETKAAEKPAGQPAEYKKRFMIRFGEHIKTLSVDEISYCYSENKNTLARATDGRTFPMDQNLDALEQMLDPKDFFRINRQFLISLKAIDEMKTYSKARVIIKLKPTVKESPVVSSERAAEFKQWLAGEI